MEDRLKTLRRVRSAISTHECPSCEGPAYCGMEAGKSSSLCWCMDVKVNEAHEVDITPRGFDTCLCKRCLTK